MDYDTNWTMWGNMSYMTPSQGVHEVLAYVEAISSPLVCLVGTLLNLMAVGAFLSKPLRRISCCLYLATRSLAVFGFLISMATAWSNTFTTFIGTEGICELTIFLSYFCPFLSVWMVVVISLENFIRIAQPSRVSSLCNPRVAQFVIATFCMIGLAVYNFPIWTSRVIDGECRVLLQYVQIVLILNYVDTALTLLAPFALLIILVPLVALTAIHAYDRKKRLAAGRILRPGTHDVKSTPEARVTHLLLAVSVVFLLLHTPFHAIRIKYFILTLAHATEQITETDQILHQVFRLFYNLDSCVSCAVYLIFGNNFRKVFYNMYFSKCHARCFKLRRMRNAHVVTSTTDNTAIEISNVDNITISSTATTPNPKIRGQQQTCQQQNFTNSNFLNNNTNNSSNSSYKSINTQNDCFYRVNEGSNNKTYDALNANTATTTNSTLLTLSAAENDVINPSSVYSTPCANGVLHDSISNINNNSNTDNVRFGHDNYDNTYNCKNNNVNNINDEDDDDEEEEDDDVDLMDTDYEERETKRGLLSSESVDV